MTKQEPVVGDLRTVTQRFNGKEWVLCLQSMPPRELSDEEILEVCLDGGYVDCISDVDLEIDGIEELKHQYLRLCKAIIKKASEK